MAATDQEEVGTEPRGTRPLRLTALYHDHLGLGATMIEHEGWLLPRSYGDPAAEGAVLRETIGLLDIGETGKFAVKGPEIDAVLLAADLTGGEIGRGTTSADGTLVYRLTSREALVLSASSAAESVHERLELAVAERRESYVIEMTSAFCGLRLRGPRAAILLERLTGLDLSPRETRNGPPGAAGTGLPDGGLAQGAVANVRALVARHDRAGVPSYDLYVDRDLGAYLWSTLLAEGAPLGIRPVGREVEEGGRDGSAATV